jgi:hypothetical protein
VKATDAVLRFASALGAAIGYGCLFAFLGLVGAQIYWWFRDGEWTHIGVGDGLRAGLAHCCVQDGATGRLAALVQWLDAPANGLGMHKVIEVIPASLALFAVSIAGNCLFIYCRDRLERR